MIKNIPQVIFCNGPGTCIPLCEIAFFFKVFGTRWSSIFYVESIARVRRLSLAGCFFTNYAWPNNCLFNGHISRVTVPGLIMLVVLCNVLILAPSVRQKIKENKVYIFFSICILIISCIK
ncbi:UDP-n-acetylglucosamine transferase subunit alg14 [Phtheirospermum japonicum]|uniref:UDP-N-acetylglucosamine transferase subunit ALG14 n=1 Tax=Phtheirospermum japonicum TaxID=374723 RepID=A0A830CE68_9LAMI|nr:UDP-n-acetylglucosamine transferase subunit alg14 [Phtheirospermum japonicum]